MELDLSNFSEAENLFRECLLKVPTVQLLTVYLDYVRRRNDLSDSTGRARETVSKTYNFVLDMIGFDKDAGDIWADYITFIQNAPGTVGGSGWQDQQKMDLLRKAYQRAICMPISNVNTLWKEYNQFEMGLNKTTGRKFLAERSPTYMSAKSAATALDNITRGLQRTTLPRLPPAPGFDGDKEYLEQVQLWKKWIAWEKTDPLDLEKEEPELLQKRINYAYKQSTMALRFWPEIWTDAAEYCFDKDIKKDGVELGSEYLQQGMEANPESVLLALKQGERIESTMVAEENDDAKAAKGNAVREPYIKVLDTLYALGKALREREKRDIARVEEAAAATAAVKAATAEEDDDDEKDEDTKDEKEGEEAEKETPTQKQVKAISQGYAAQSQMMNRVITSVWIALTRAMRRIQGKGKPGTPLGGMREVFTEARKRGRLTSDIYIAVAQMEWLVYKDSVGAKIFERGQKLFPEDEDFTIEYLKFLHAKDDNISKPPSSDCTTLASANSMFAQMLVLSSRLS
jgi:cleavage stimulation factor subunit 3